MAKKRSINQGLSSGQEETEVTLAPVLDQGVERADSLTGELQAKTGQELREVLEDPEARRLIEVLRGCRSSADVEMAKEDLFKFVSDKPELAPTLIQALEDEEFVMKREINIILNEIATPFAIQDLIQALLIQALQNKDEEARKVAIKALGKITTPEAIQALTQALQNRNEYNSVREAAALALGLNANPKAVSALSQALQNIVGDSIKNMATWALGKNATPEAIQTLIQIIKDKNTYYRDRQAATQTLSSIDNPEAIQALISALKDKNHEVGSAAARALGKIATPEAIQALIQALKEGKRTNVTTQVAISLGESKDILAVSALINALQNDKSKQLIVEAARALGKIATPEALQSLTWALHNSKSKEAKVQAADALIMSDNKEVTSALTHALHNQQEHRVVREASAVTLFAKPSVNTNPFLEIANSDDSFFDTKKRMKISKNKKPSTFLKSLRKRIYATLFQNYDPAQEKADQKINLTYAQHLLKSFAELKESAARSDNPNHRTLVDLLQQLGLERDLKAIELRIEKNLAERHSVMEDALFG